MLQAQNIQKNTHFQQGTDAWTCFPVPGKLDLINRKCKQRTLKPVFLSNFLQEHGYPGAFCFKQDRFIWAVGRQGQNNVKFIKDGQGDPGSNKLAL